MNRNLVHYRVSDDEIDDLAKEGQASRPRRSISEVARSRMRQWGRLRDKHEALEQKVAELQVKVDRLTHALAGVFEVLLPSLTKMTPETAKRWVKENLLR
jgi:hypothetical protein